MAEIPRFYAQINAISVPKMQDFTREQNESIYQSLKAAGERINNTFFEMIAEGQLGQPNTQQQNQLQQNRAYFDRAVEVREASNKPNPNLVG